MTKTVLYTGLYVFLALLPFPGFLQAQESGIRPIQISDIRQIAPPDLAALPANVRQVREAQLRLAREDNAVIEIIDSPEKSQTIIHQVPDFLSSRTITNEDEAIALIQDLYPYYGFGDTESLVLDREFKYPKVTSYKFDQYINDIKIPGFVRIYIDNATEQITRIRSSRITIDIDLPRTPQLISEEEAIEAAMELANAKEAENVAEGGGLIYRLDGSDIYTKVKEYVFWGEEAIPEPLWTVYIPLLEPWDPDYTHDAFRVKPNGEVIDPVMILDAARVCDGFQPSKYLQEAMVSIGPH